MRSSRKKLLTIYETLLYVCGASVIFEAVLTDDVSAWQFDGYTLRYCVTFIPIVFFVFKVFA